MNYPRGLRGSRDYFVYFSLVHSSRKLFLVQIQSEPRNIDERLSLSRIKMDNKLYSRIISVQIIIVDRDFIKWGNIYIYISISVILTSLSRSFV